MEKIKNNDNILLLIIVSCFLFAFYAYASSTDLTLKTQIITAILAILATVVAYRYGSSKSSAKKDEIIKSMSDKKANDEGQ